ncbi:hypothetical protein [Fluviispira multicolorata]|uniref:Uncharacterized protein n=1 Tax=Fluviispira multicolorata TaxID=2654512 RepID=A0A833N6A4_9BACT|nr:hypothetical protein [Fluviispira multicolorata]KAB8029823.1 hypothetical protein GCL57_09800 [Fluviispira multicolorata]
MKKLYFYFFSMLFFYNQAFSLNLCTDGYIDYRRPAIPFVPFRISDTESGKLLSPDDIMTALDRNGKKYSVKAKDFYEQINSIEFSLNQWGYSLRDSTGSYNLSSLDSCLKLLENQKSIINKNLIQEPVNEVLNYEDWKKKVKSLSDEQNKNYPQFKDLIKHRDANKYDEYISNVKAFDVPRPLLKKVNMSLFEKEKNWVFEKGEISKFFIGGSAGYGVKASQLEVASTAYAGIDAALLGLWHGSVVSAVAKANSPGTGIGHLNISANVFGSTLFAFSEELKSSAYAKETDLFNSPLNFEKSTHFLLGPIPIKLTLGIRGNNTMKWGLDSRPLQMQSYLQHYASIDAYGAAAVDILIAGVGVQGRILLIAIDTRVAANALVEYNDTLYFKLNIIGKTDVNALYGDLKVVVYTYLPTLKFWNGFLEKKEWFKRLGEYPGFKFSGSLFDYSATLTPTGFSAKGDLSVEDVADQLNINKNLNRKETIISLARSTSKRSRETVRAIEKDLEGEENILLLNEEKLLSENEVAMMIFFDDFERTLKEIDYIAEYL